jgi:hypothetical protein
VLHFQITERTVHRALSEGMFLKRIVGTLENHSRTPGAAERAVLDPRLGLAGGAPAPDADYLVRTEDPRPRGGSSRTRA